MLSSLPTSQPFSPLVAVFRVVALQHGKGVPQRGWKAGLGRGEAQAVGLSGAEMALLVVGNEARDQSWAAPRQDVAFSRVQP